MTPITFLPDGIERPLAFLNCTFEGPKSRPPSASSLHRCAPHKRCQAGRTQHLPACCYPPHSEPMLRKCQYSCQHHRANTRTPHQPPLCLPLPPPSQSTGLHQRRGLSCLSLLPDASGSLPTYGVSCHSGGTRPLERGGAVLVSRALCFSLRLALAFALIELAVFRCVVGTSTHEASLSFASSNGVNVHRCRACTVGFRLNSTAICRRSGQTEETLTCSGAPLDTSNLLPTSPHFGFTQECEMPGLRSSCRLKRFQDFHLRTLGFPLSQPIQERVCGTSTSRVPTR